MIIRTVTYTAFVLACTIMPGIAVAIDALEDCDGPVKFDGRHYEVVADNDVTWDAADATAKNEEFVGVKGHLATITSEAEDVFVEALRKCARQRSSNRLTRQAVWVGGFQDPVDVGTGAGWQWVNSEGPISTPQVPLLSYSNWLAGEPNDYRGRNESHLTIGHSGNFGWNDEGSRGNVGGYIIEYDTSSQINVIQCTQGDGCVTTAGQTMLFPPVANEDATIRVRTYEFTDDPARCGKTPLVLFDGTDPRDELHIPAYLCGSPRFLVVEVVRDGFEVLQGAVRVENEPLEALPGNWYECDGPVNGDPQHANDPQRRDVVAWQSTNFSAMREDSLGGKVDPMFAGALGEYTFECGSSRGLIKTASYFVIGMHINFGEDYDYVGNPDGVHERFVALTGYKLQLLKEAVEASRPALKNGDYVVLRTHLGNALRFHGRGQFDSASKSIGVFLKMVEAATYETIDGENYHGEHLSRGQNIKFMYEEKVIPFAP